MQTRQRQQHTQILTCEPARPQPQSGSRFPAGQRHGWAPGEVCTPRCLITGDGRSTLVGEGNFPRGRGLARVVRHTHPGFFFLCLGWDGDSHRGSSHSTGHTFLFLSSYISFCFFPLYIQSFFFFFFLLYSSGASRRRRRPLPQQPVQIPDGVFPVVDGPTH